MLRLTAEKIADVGMVGIAKVRKDISKGKLDADSLADVVRYILANRLLAVGLGAFDGAVSKEGVGVLPDGVSVGFPDVESEWSGTEESVMANMINEFSKTRKQAEAAVKKMRVVAEVERLGEEHLEELGL